jgi:hypothetical protein
MSELIIDKLSTRDGSNVGAIVVADIDELLLLNTNKEINTTAIVKDNNRGGVFNYDGAQSGVNNGGTIFNGWVRQYDGAVNVKWFQNDDGTPVMGDGINDDTTGIQSALGTNTRDVRLPSGVYCVSSLSIPSNTNLKGTGWCDRDSSVWYSGRPVVGGGTAIIGTGEWATLSMIGSEEDKISNCNIEDMEIFCEPHLDADGSWANNKPKYNTSTCISSHFGGGHKLQNVRVASYGYAGVEFGINRSYNSVVYSAVDSSGGKGSNNHMEGCYYSSGWGVGILNYSEQFHLSRTEGDSYQLNTYSGWTNPVSGLTESWGCVVLNTVGIFIDSCHFECHQDRASGLYIDRITGVGTYPTQINITNCKFYNGIHGLVIGAGVLDSSISASNVSGTFSGDAVRLEGKCSFVGNAVTNATAKVVIVSQETIVTDCVFKDNDIGIEVEYRGIIKYNSFNNVTVGVKITATSTSGIIISDNKLCTIDVNGNMIHNNMVINSSQLGLSTSNGVQANSLTFKTVRVVNTTTSSYLFTIHSSPQAPYLKRSTKVVNAKISYGGIQNQTSERGFYYETGTFLTNYTAAEHSYIAHRAISGDFPVGSTGSPSVATVADLLEFETHYGDDVDNIDGTEYTRVYLKNPSTSSSYSRTVSIEVEILGQYYGLSFNEEV